MDNNISNIKKHPSPFCDALYDATDLIFFPDFVFYCIGQALKHSVACTCADNKIICKIDLFSDIHQRYFFRFMIFQYFDNFSSKCYGFQFVLLFFIVCIILTYFEILCTDYLIFGFFREQYALH